MNTVGRALINSPWFIATNRYFGKAVLPKFLRCYESRIEQPKQADYSSGNDDHQTRDDPIPTTNTVGSTRVNSLWFIATTRYFGKAVLPKFLSCYGSRIEYPKQAEYSSDNDDHQTKDDLIPTTNTVRKGTSHGSLLQTKYLKKLSCILTRIHRLPDHHSLYLEQQFTRIKIMIIVDTDAAVLRPHIVE